MIRALALCCVLAVPVVAKAEGPALKTMQAALAKKKRYGTLQLMSTQVLKLDKKAVTLLLPNKKNAELSLESLEAGVATVRVKIPPADTASKLGREGSLFLHAGKHEAGDLWLVLSHPKE